MRNQNIHNDQGVQSSSGYYRKTEDTLSLLVGIGIGGALMYLLDPDKGASRRQSMYDSAREQLGNASEALSEMGSTTSRRIGSKIRDASNDLLRRGSQSGSNVVSSLSDSADRMRKNLVQRWQPEEEHGIIGPALGITSGTVAILALGAGLMYFFDPDRGRARRAYMTDQVRARMNDAGDLARKSGRHLSNKLRGTYYETRKAVGMPAEHSSRSESQMPSQQPQTQM